MFGSRLYPKGPGEFAGSDCFIPLPPGPRRTLMLVAYSLFFLALPGCWEISGAAFSDYFQKACDKA